MLIFPPTELMPWLTCTSSLTQKLRERADDVQLQVLRHEWDAVNQWDEQVLMIADESVIHREIIMRASHIPCWYARTILPQRTFLANQPLFERLKHEPLGQLIFHSGCIQRVSLQHDSLDSSCPEWNWLPKNLLSNTPNQLWCRLSTFELMVSHDRFYLLEILLPGLEQFW